MSSSTKQYSWERVLACCDSFKGTLTACDAGLAIERAFRGFEKGGSARVDVVHCPMSDGGAGLLDSLLFPDHSQLSSPYTFTKVEVPTAGATGSAELPQPPLVVGPLGEPLNCVGSAYRPYFACDVANRVVVVEMAIAAGLPMVPEEERNPLRTTSYGVGQVIKYAVEYVATQQRRMHGPDADGGVTVFLGIGGSATNDGGLGALQALGLEMLVKGKLGGAEPLSTPFVGGDLERLVGVRPTPAFRQMFFCAAGSCRRTPYCREVRLIVDVASPLVGPDGATAIFGPQKCSSAWDKARRESVLARLERGMLNASAAVARSNLHGKAASEAEMKRRLDGLRHTHGGGGAGGMSGLFRYIAAAKWMSGADVVAELLGLPAKLQRCDCMITGEGSFDEQTIRFNKTLGRLLQMVVLENVRRGGAGQQLLGDVLVICGRTSYRDEEEVQRVLLDHMRKQKEHDDAAALAAAVPRVHLLALTPDHFPVSEALGKAGVCVEERMRRFLAGEERPAGEGRAVVPVAEKKHPKL
ncbi:putative glycerate kinase [Trypanosoma conorhini]|uniref:Putative glycerate kinase n=1 Tax=Trypanosoma conorhini TaxID=83891 RepID=A0A422NDF6_9TRYP|nr:putative glycerate kinase [Trypanosoma conorhini]RNF03515.1 putative glycerate kinase [Trypanosoma conorhini]